MKKKDVIAEIENRLEDWDAGMGEYIRDVLKEVNGTISAEKEAWRNLYANLEKAVANIERRLNLLESSDVVPIKSKSRT